MTSIEAAALLGVAPGASIDDVQRAFVHAVRDHHPDRFAEGSDEDRAAASARFRTYAEARDVLIRERPVIPVTFDYVPSARKPKGIGGSVIVLVILAALLVLGVTMADGYRMETVENLRGGYIQPK